MDGLPNGSQTAAQFSITGEINICALLSPGSREECLEGAPCCGVALLRKNLLGMRTFGSVVPRRSSLVLDLTFAQH